MDGDGKLKEAEVVAGVMPPLDEVVRWRLEEREDFAKYRAEHREIFFDKIVRACRGSRHHMARQVVMALAPWIRVMAEHEIRLREMRTHEGDLNGLNDQELTRIQELEKRIEKLEKAATKPKPTKKRGRPKGSKNKKKGGAPGETGTHED